MGFFEKSFKLMPGLRINLKIQTHTQVTKVPNGSLPARAEVDDSAMAGNEKYQLPHASQSLASENTLASRIFALVCLLALGALIIGAVIHLIK